MFMITVKILLCLDCIHCNFGGLFRGSPLLLEIWLQERLWMIHRPDLVDNYLDRNFHMRGRLYLLWSRTEWRVFFHGDPMVRWTVRWWWIRSMLYVDPTIPYVRLLGVTSVTFIFSVRILRKLGFFDRYQGAVVSGPGPFLHSILGYLY